MIKYTDEDYINCDVFGGDQDVDIRCQEVKIVTARKEHLCHGCLIDGTEHIIMPGERARFEKALVDGAWGSYYHCLPNLEKWMNEINGYCCSDCKFWDYKEDDTSIEFKCLCKDSPNFDQLVRDDNNCNYFEDYIEEEN